MSDLDEGSRENVSARPDEPIENDADSDEDAYDELRPRQALPVAEGQDGCPPPQMDSITDDMTAEEYLRAVRWQARQIPKVITYTGAQPAAHRPPFPRPQPNGTAAEPTTQQAPDGDIVVSESREGAPSGLSGALRHVRGDQGGADTTTTTSGTAAEMSATWVNDVVFYFKNLRLQVHGTRECEPSGVARSRDEWMAAYPSLSPSVDTLRQMDSVETCKMVDVLAEVMSKTTAAAISVDQGTAARQLHVCRWLFLLLVNLDELQARDEGVAADLQAIRKHCDAWRAHLLSTGVGSVGESCRELLASVSVISLIVGEFFRQR
ncbi:unnamed protein product [Vitrella brassicaformis CCMP3155]|uniref:Gem-associated protein 2 n=1 Tax=Vitrella brassicaformis (strain CCMP3155) TaxID=1169540 RepID=A0A0G4FDW4_VITBC|nr:unnamed protein product [Vitrella brassicaformis CCMP3155]|eukprot:CEM11064.1 unnamed protein product [Vitrella brassicaformis CCMP3155]